MENIAKTKPQALIAANYLSMLAANKYPDLKPLECNFEWLTPICFISPENCDGLRAFIQHCVNISRHEDEAAQIAELLKLLPEQE